MEPSTLNINTRERFLRRVVVKEGLSLFRDLFHMETGRERFQERVVFKGGWSLFRNSFHTEI